MKSSLRKLFCTIALLAFGSALITPAHAARTAIGTAPPPIIFSPKPVTSSP